MKHAGSHPFGIDFGFAIGSVNCRRHISVHTSVHVPEAAFQSDGQADGNTRWQPWDAGYSDGTGIPFYPPNFPLFSAPSFPSLTFANPTFDPFIPLAPPKDADPHSWGIECNTSHPFPHSQDLTSSFFYQPSPSSQVSDALTVPDALHPSLLSPYYDDTPVLSPGTSSASSPSSQTPWLTLDHPHITTLSQDLPSVQDPELSQPQSIDWTFTHPLPSYSLLPVTQEPSPKFNPDPVLGPLSSLPGFPPAGFAHMDAAATSEVHDSAAIGVSRYPIILADRRGSVSEAFLEWLATPIPIPDTDSFFPSSPLSVDELRPPTPSVTRANARGSLPSPSSNKLSPTPQDHERLLDENGGPDDRTPVDVVYIDKKSTKKTSQHCHVRQVQRPTAEVPPGTIASGSSSVAGPASMVAANRKKVTRCCDGCRKSKIKCEREKWKSFEGESTPCQSCVKRGRDCTWTDIVLPRGHGVCREYKRKLLKMERKKRGF